MHHARFLLWCAVVCGIAPEARAQLIDQYFPAGVPAYDATPGVTVLSRLHPEYEPPGVRIGDFFINPNLRQSIGYDSNATGEPRAQPSLLEETEATLEGKSDWGRDSMDLFASVDDRRYPRQSAQSTTDWTATAAGTYDIGRDQVAVTLSHLNLNETPRDLNAPQLSQPAPYSVNLARATYTANFGAFSLIPGINYSTWRYSNIVQSGTPLVLTYQNRDVLIGSLTARYEASPLRSLLAVLRGVQNRYDSPQAGLPNRNSNGGDALVGVDYAAGAVWRYHLLVGVQWRDFASNTLKTISGPTAQADVIWQPTGLTTVTGSFLHAIEDAAQPDISSYTLTQGKLVIDHELRRNVLLQARTELDEAVLPQHSGRVILYNSGVSATWLVNRRARLIASYDYSNRQSGSTSYTENVALVRIAFGL